MSATPNACRIDTLPPDLQAPARPETAELRLFDPDHPPRVLVSLATYNERDNLEPLLGAVHERLPFADALVIDDNSPDGTGALADALAAADRRVRVLHRPGKLGLGTALLAAMRFAMEHGYDYMLNMDADFSHPPRYLPGLLEGMAAHDLMIGSRYIPGGGTEDWHWKRLWMSKGVNWLVRWLFGVRVRDASGGFRCYRVEMLRRARLERLRSLGYSFQQEVLLRCLQAGGRVGEFPIVFENRKAGASKVDLRETTRSLWTLVRLGVRYRLGMEK
jgi:dolichol-phosphate mannosyltransferase